MNKLTLLALTGFCALASASTTNIDNDYSCEGTVNGVNLTVVLKRETRSTPTFPSRTHEGVAVTWKATWSPAARLRFVDGKIVILQVETARFEEVETHASPSIKSVGSGTNVFELGTISTSHTKSKSPLYFEEDLNRDAFSLVFFDEKSSPVVLSKCSVLR